MKKLFATLLFLSAGLAHAAPIELIKNGSFEANGVANGTWTIKSALDFWTVGPKGAEVRNNVAGKAQDGNNFLELDTTANSWISQSVSTVAGGLYNLSFWYAARPNTGANTNGIDVYWNNTLLRSTALDNFTGNNNWMKLELSVMALSSLSTLEFRAAGLSDSYGGSLDNVSLTRAVPEPGTLAMFGLGAGLLGLARRRRG